MSGFLILCLFYKANLQQLLRESFGNLVGLKVHENVLHLECACERFSKEIENYKDEKKQKIENALQQDANGKIKQKLLILFQAAIYITFILTIEEERNKMKPLSGEKFVKLITNSTIFLLQNADLKTDFFVLNVVFEKARGIFDSLTPELQKNFANTIICGADFKNEMSQTVDISHVFPTQNRIEMLTVFSFLIVPISVPSVVKSVLSVFF